MLQSLRVLSEDTYLDSLKSSIARSHDSAALVFVHGFNVSFNDALRRTAQVAYDLGFDGAAVAYSWPSKGDVQGYVADLGEADWTAPHLQAFLQLLFARSGAKHIDVIAHSMGGRALTQALDRLASAKSHAHFDQVVFAAADVDRDVFNELLPRIRPFATRITLYSSGRDVAMVLSRKVSTHQRVGDINPSVYVADGADTIDASAIPTDLIGHGYFAESKEVLDDLFQLVTNGQPPNRRRLNRIGTGAQLHWSLP